MIHHRLVDDIPDLQLADFYRLVVMVPLVIDDKVEPAAKAELEA